MKWNMYFITVLLIYSISSFAQTITGAGTPNYISKFTSASVLGNSLIYDNGTNVGVGNSSPLYKLDVTGAGRFSSDVFVNNITIGLGAGNIISNSVIGYQAGKLNTTGTQNAYFGYQAGASNTNGYQNNFIGYQAGASNTSGYQNNFIGYQAGNANTSGYVNTFIGYLAGQSNTTGINNNCIGNQAGLGNLIGNNNNFFGSASGQNINTGSNNTIIGHLSGGGITTGSNNTIIGAFVSGLSANLSNNVIIADGGGNRRINIDATGNVGIGTDDTKGYKLAVNGSAVFTKAVVKLYGGWPDYVFQDKYELLPLIDLKEFLIKNKHLPELPSASEVAKNGIDLGNTQAILLKKLEELT